MTRVETAEEGTSRKRMTYGQDTHKYSAEEYEQDTIKGTGRTLQLSPLTASANYMNETQIESKQQGKLKTRRRLFLIVYCRTVEC